MKLPIFVLLSGVFFASTLNTGCNVNNRGAKTVQKQPMTVFNFSEVGQEGLLEQCQRQVANAQSVLVEILSAKEPRSVENTLVPYNEMEILLDKAASLASLMSETHPDSVIRENAERCEQEVHRFVTDLSLNQELYQAFRGLDVAKLDEGAKRLAEKIVRDFLRSGVDKDEATRAKIKAVEEELVLIAQEFSRNIREDIRSIEVDAISGLLGLPQDFIDSHKPLANGKVKISTDYPDYVPYMSYADDAGSRYQLWMTYNQRGYPKNENVLNSMIAKRYELAQMLGYASYADYVVEDKMIKKTQNVAEFIEKINGIAKPLAQKEYAKLLEEKRRTDKSATQVMGFERSYLEEKYKKRQFNFDSQSVRPYFRFEKVRDGLLALTGELFGISYKRIENAKLWHPSVEAYDVFDGQTQIGRIYLDLHPRENKYKHAAQFTVQSGVLGKQIPEGALVCNFADPSVSTPALMDHDQVVTFFHEFGHLLHHVLGGNQKWITFSGVATEWDFVEAPSQFFEEWAWDAGVLQRFALHHETGEPIPSTLIANMRAADEFGKGLDTRQQMFYASLSLQYYLRDPKSFEALELLQELQGKYSQFPYIEGTHFHLNFGHLEGYSAMYYTYMWSKVIAKDLLKPFKENALMNQEVARRYRKTILDAGGSKDASALVEEFLGRPYSFEAYREWMESSAGPEK